MLIENDNVEKYIQMIQNQKNVPHEHSVQVSKYALKLGMRTGCSEKSLQHLVIGGLLHDVGKVYMNDELFTNTTLNSRLKDQIFNHTIMGVSLASNLNLPQEVMDIILLHHERVDGSGYPYQLFGYEIPKLVKIISICDAYSAMISERSYSESKTKEEAIEELVLNKGTQFDASLVDYFIEVLEDTI